MPQVHFRTSSERLAVSDRAAAIRGVSRTEFVLQSSEAAAIEILNERPVIALDDEAWDDFIAALDGPVEIDPAVKARYAHTPEWDGQRTAEVEPLPGCFRQSWRRPARRIS